MARKRESEVTLQAVEVEMIEAVVGQGFNRALAEQIVQPIVRHLSEKFPSERLYFPAAKREYNLEQIRADLMETKNPEAVCERHGLSRATLYRIVGKDAA